MNNRPNLPEDILRVQPHCWRASLRAGGYWMFAVFLTDVPGASVLKRYPDWPLALRTCVALIPLAAGLLYVLATARWIRGMDELHRRVSISAFLFSAVAYLVLSSAWGLLDRAGVWSFIYRANKLGFIFIDFRLPTLAIALTYVFFGVGYSVLNRRYK
jgi:hypothetical protein